MPTRWLMLDAVWTENPPGEWTCGDAKIRRLHGLHDTRYVVCDGRAVTFHADLKSAQLAYGDRREQAARAIGMVKETEDEQSGRA